MSEFNLISEKWIPCIDLSGKHDEYGISHVLLNSHLIKEIYDESPLVTVALHRLLLAILYRAFDGPRSLSAWEEMYQKNEFDRKKIKDYLGRWENRFDLFSTEYPFYQMADFKMENKISINRLSIECSSGHNSTLFDHSMDEEEINWPPSFLARQLIAHQTFALDGAGNTKKTVSGKIELQPRYSDSAVTRGMNFWLQGNNLLETLMINLAIDSEDTSLPPWELDEPNKYRDNPYSEKDRNPVSPFGKVDQLTWQSRLIRLISENNMVLKMFYAQGRSADKNYFDPMCFYRIDGEGIHLMKLSREKSFWRDVHTILEKKTDTKNVRPECIKLAAYTKEEGILTEDKIFILHIAGISASKAKVFLWRHERMPLPVIVIVNQNLHERLNTSTTEAEILAIKAKDRIEKILRMYLSPDQNKSIDKKQLEKLVEAFDPRPVFWSRLEKHFYEFLENLPGDWDLKKNEWKADDKQEATKKWRKRILQEAHDALKESALSLGTTSRALRAVARTRLYFIEEDLKPLKEKEVTNTKQSGQKGGMEN